MSIGQIVVLAVIVGAFVVFAAVLGWGDYRTQQLTRRIRDRGDRKARGDGRVRNGVVEGQQVRGHRIGDCPSALAAAAVRAIAARRLKSR